MTEVVVRPDDDVGSLRRKVRIATVLGTIQSTYTDFRYVRNIWKRNAEEERLLGVSLTGIYDNPLTSDGERAGDVLEALKGYAIEVNQEYAGLLGINPSAATTTVKPSGTVSQLVNSASGIHPRHSPYYIRSIRQDNKDPMTQFLKDQGIPNEPCVMKGDTTTVFYFPIKSPDSSVFRDNLTARDHLNLWDVYNKHWAEHQVSITVSVREDEWLDTAAWVYENFDNLSGVSFLPMDGGTYKQAPYQEVSKENYEALLKEMPKELDWSKLSDYEKEDTTTGSRELACTGLSCEIIY